MTIRTSGRPRTLLGLALGIAGLLAVTAAPTLAAATHVFSTSLGTSGSGDGQVSSPQGVALNSTSHDVYVADTGNARIDQFSSSGTFIRAFGADVGGAGVNVCTTGCVAGTPGSGAGAFTTPTFIAVDNSGGASDGDVYVGDTGTNLVQKFDASGNLITAWGSGGQLDGSTATDGPFGALAGIAVDTSGNLFVYDQNAEMFKFGEDGSFITDFNTSFGVTPAGIAVDSSGNLYIVRGSPVVEKLDSSGGDIGQVTDDPAFSSTSGLAVDPSNNGLYVDDGGALIRHYADTSCASSNSCQASDSFGSGDLSGAAGLAVDSSNAKVYAADAGNQRIAVLTAATLPDVTTEPATNIAATSATVNGTVNPDGVQVTDCHFDYGTTTAYGQTAPCAETVGSGTSDVAVHADLSNLPTGSIHFRLVAANADGQSLGDDRTTACTCYFGFDGTLLPPDGVSASLSTTQAGAHPDFTTSFRLNGDPANSVGGQNFPWGSLRNLAVELPPGLVGNPNAFPTCSAAVLSNAINLQNVSGAQQCPADSQIGIVQPGTFNGPTPGTIPEPLYNVASPGGDVVARLGFIAVLYPVFIDVKIDPQRDNALTAEIVNSPSNAGLTGAVTTLWGVPADPSHDGERLTPVDTIFCNGPCGPSPSGLAPIPFMTNPTSCGPKTVGFTADSYPLPDRFVHADAPLPDITGCDQVPFNPTINLQPTTQEADSPSGMDVNIHVPQDGLASPNLLASAHLKKAVVTLPEGMALNPSAGDGLAGCTEAQIGLTDEGPPARFNAADPTCPDGSVVGTAKITTPVLGAPIDGTLYLADPNDNPFHSLLTGYLVAHGQGVLLKIPGRFDLDPNTGRITATFDNNPQDPFTDLELHFKGGSRGVLVTPPSCGTYQIDSKLSPWSAADPNNPTPAETKDLVTSFDITTGPGGGPCPDYTDPNRFTPGFSAGTVNPTGGEYSPFVLNFSRPDGQQSLKKIAVTLPLGLTAKLAGIPRCPQSAIVPGVGGSTNCPAASQVGSVNVGAGAGSTPFFLKDQPVYLTEGYGGAPFGLAIDTHAVAGPLDLGHVVIRSRLNVDPQTAQVSADADPLPNIIDGILLHIRSVTLTMDHPAFTLNPTNCSPQTISAQITGGGADFANPADDTVKQVTQFFQPHGCGALGFSPKMSASILNGRQGIHRSDHPNLQVNLHANPGDANIRSVLVTLPQAFQIDQANLGNICSETQLAQTQCAGRNTVGTATATTPLLNGPLSGPVYAVSGSGGLPKLAVILNGEVNLLLRGITTTAGAQLQNTFPTVPDAPVSDFSLTLKGGPTGYLVNNRDVCGQVKKRKGKKKLVRTPLAMSATLTAQNDDTLTQSVPISAACPHKKAKRRHSKGKRH